MKLARLLFFLFLFSSLSSLAQGPASEPNSIDSKGLIKGRIVDQSIQTPLEFATVSILSSKDSSIVTGGITDDQGVFSIEVDFGVYIVKAEFISYTPKWYGNIIVSKDNPVADLQTVGLGTDAQTLQEIEVRAEKSQLQMAFDKKVFNVGKDLANTSGSAVELLNNIPSVTVDVEGTVSLRGSEGVRILVDGRPSGLVGLRGSNGLKSIPSNLIEKIEIVTNPSARYEAEGMSGIINIVLKKEKSKGLNGSFDLSGGIPGNAGTAINLNYRKGKINVFANYGINWRTGPGISTLYQEFYDSAQVNIVDQIRDRERRDFSNSFRAGMDFAINEKNTLTGSLVYRVSNDKSTSEIIYRNYLNNFPENLTSIRVRTEDQKEEEPNLEYSVNYKRTFNKKDQQWTTSLQYQDSFEDGFSNYKETTNNAEFVPTADDILQTSSNKEGERSWLIQSDYEQPIGKAGKFEFGYRGSFRQIDNDYEVQNFLDNEWAIDPNLSNNFNYDENINAVYSSLSNKLGKFSYQFGLRYEHSDVLTELIQTNEINHRVYSNLFPSTFLGYELPESNSVQISYSRRLRRPRFWDLNPFFTFSDSRNIFRGNPNLDPVFTNSFELSHIKYWEKTTITSSVYYRQSKGVIQRILSLVEQNGDLITIRQPENLATEDAYGMEFIVATDPTDWWRLNGNINFFRAITDGSNINSNFKADTYSLSGRVNSRTTLWKSVDVQMSFDYQAPRITTQGKDKSMAAMDLGISRDVLNKKGTLTLSVRDVFNSRRFRNETFGEDFFSVGSHQWRARQATLTFNYRLNQQKQRNKRDENREGGDFGGDQF